MSPLARTLTRTRLQAPLRQMHVRQIETMVSTKTSGRAKPEWGAQWRRVGGTALMCVCPASAFLFICSNPLFLSPESQIWRKY